MTKEIKWPALTSNQLVGLVIAKAMRPTELVNAYSKWSEDFYCAGFLNISSPDSLIEFLDDLGGEANANRPLEDYEQELVEIIRDWPFQTRFEEADAREKKAREERKNMIDTFKRKNMIDAYIKHYTQ